MKIFEMFKKKIKIVFGYLLNTSVIDDIIDYNSEQKLSICQAFLLRPNYTRCGIRLPSRIL